MAIERIVLKHLFRLPKLTLVRGQQFSEAGVLPLIEKQQLTRQT